MTDTGAERRTPRLTSRGLATRARIVRAAAELMRVKGVNATTLDDVRSASGTSKSQLYHHFADKEALVRDVIALQSEFVIDREQRQLQRLSSFGGLERWRTALVQNNALDDGAYGCVLGSLASELADQNDEARFALAATFTAWEGLIAEGLRRMQQNGALSETADPERLATGLLAALQGGYLLAQAAHSVMPMEIALDMALDQVRTYLTN